MIGWAELCERKKLTARSCFQLEWLDHKGSEEWDGCGLAHYCYFEARVVLTMEGNLVISTELRMPCLSPSILRSLPILTKP